MKRVSLLQKIRRLPLRKGLPAETENDRKNDKLTTSFKSQFVKLFRKRFLKLETYLKLGQDKVRRS
jgi:hypothetical protein